VDLFRASSRVGNIDFCVAKPPLIGSKKQGFGCHQSVFGGLLTSILRDPLSNEFLKANFAIQEHRASVSSVALIKVYAL
jgi:hypothetical protein